MQVIIILENTSYLITFDKPGVITNKYILYPSKICVCVSTVKSETTTTRTLWSSKCIDNNVF